MGFTQAMAAGYEMGSRWKNRDREEQIRKGIEEAAKLTPTENPSGQVQLGGGMEALDTARGLATQGIEAGTPEHQAALDKVTADYQPTIDALRARQGVKGGFQMGGKSYDAMPTEAEQDRARMSAMSGVYAKNGDPTRAIELRSMARRGEMEDMQLEGAKREEAYRLGIPELQKGSRFAQVQADGGKYSPMDSMADTANFLAYGAKHGKYDIAGWQGLAEKTQKLEAEGFNKALNLADAGGTLDEIAKVYNTTGADKFDPKSVISDTKGTALLRGEKIATRIITYKDAAGNVRTINTAADLAGLGQTRELLATHFAAKADQRGDKSIANESARVGIAQADSDRAKEKHDIEMPGVKSDANRKVRMDEAQDAYNKAVAGGDAKAIEIAHKQAIAAGVKFPKEVQEYATTTDSMGNSITRTNKATGQVDIINPRDPAKVVTIAAPGATQGAQSTSSGIPSFATESEAKQAARSGKIKEGQKITVGGITGAWKND